MKIKTFKIGGSVKIIDRAGKENFLTVEMMDGHIALMNKSGGVAMTRSLITDGDTQYFTVRDQKFTRKTI